MHSGDPAPSCGNHSVAKSVWYQFTAPSAGNITADTFGTTYDTLLSVYTGTCYSLTAVPSGCNDDAPAVAQSRLSFAATEGTTYFFMITAYSGNGGTLVFHLAFAGAGPTATVTPIPTGTRTATRTRTPAAMPTLTPTVTPVAGATHTPTPTPLSPSGVANDACVDASLIAAAPYASTVSTSAATTDGTDPLPSCGNHSMAKSVWYRFTASTAGTITADTLGSSYDTIVSVYTGTCAALASVSGGCNDDAPSVVQSRVSVAATGGTTYFFLVTAYSGSGGTLVFHLSAAP